MASLEFHCPSGIAGNLWMAALLGLGADPSGLDDLPGRLGVAYATIEWHRNDVDGRTVSEVSVHGTAGAPPATFADLVAAISGAGLGPAVTRDAVRVLELRQRAEGEFNGFDIHTRTYFGDDVADTLIDVVGGVLMWHRLDRPIVTTTGPVALGGKVLGPTRLLMQDLPTCLGDSGYELTTPTGAALLADRWRPGRAAGLPVREVRVPSDFSTAGRLEPLAAALYD